ncbi:hypothetical protein JCM3765_005957 [Sporobolomyces pararoseus]
MLPRPTNEYDNAEWQQHHPTNSSTPPTSSTSTPSLSTFSSHLPDPGQPLGGYGTPYNESQYPQMHSTELASRSTGEKFSPVQGPPQPLSSSIDAYSSPQSRPNGVTMYPPSEQLNPLPDSRGQWSAHDRRKSCRVNTSRVNGDGVNEAISWNNQLASNGNQRRASWASPSLPPFGQPHQFSHSPLTNDGSFLSPLSAPHSLPSSSSSSSNHIPPPLNYQRDSNSYPPPIQFQPSFLSSSNLSASSSSSSSPYPPTPHYPFQPPSIGPSHDLSLPFRDFTGSSHPQLPPPSFTPSFPLPLQHQHGPPQYLGNSLPPSHLGGGSPQVPLTAYLPSPALRAPSPPRNQTRRRSSVLSQPANPSSPFIPSADPSKPPAAVLKAAAHRQKLGVLDITGRLRPATDKTRKTMLQASSRRAVELEFNCTQCGGGIGKLTLRGGAVDQAGGDEPANYFGRFFCSNCTPLPAAGGNGKDRELAFTGYNDEAVYEDTLSGAVDRFEGLDLSRTDIRPPPAPPGKSRTGFTPTEALSSSKKRRASVLDATEGLLGCDVCRREIGSGELTRTDGEPVNASIEVLCAFCDSRYLRCSDCGGGGGTKGVGRWRCKEMFPHGRRTCQLLHTRLGSVNEMDYDVWPISQLSEDERDKVSTICAELHASSILGTLAVPDMIESVSAIARSFEEVEKICYDCWTTYDPLIRYDIQATSPAATKRYVALRWSTPTVRKKKSRAKNPSLNADGTPSRRGGSRAKPRASPSMSPDAGNGEPILFREGKTLSGFIIAEHDLEDGVLHVALTVPTGAGEAYDATSRLLQTLIARAYDDLEAMNAERVAQNIAPYPPLTQAWTMHMTKRDSRIMSRVETRRGFIPLEDYLSTHPESRRECFAPLRETYLPPELLRGWLVYVKEISFAEDFPPNYQEQRQQRLQDQQQQQEEHLHHHSQANGQLMYPPSSHYQ